MRLRRKARATRLQSAFRPLAWETVALSFPRKRESSTLVYGSPLPRGDKRGAQRLGHSGFSPAALSTGVQRACSSATNFAVWSGPESVTGSKPAWISFC